MNVPANLVGAGLDQMKFDLAGWRCLVDAGQIVVPGFVPLMPFPWAHRDRRRDHFVEREITVKRECNSTTTRHDRKNTPAATSWRLSITFFTTVVDPRRNSLSVDELLIAQCFNRIEPGSLDGGDHAADYADQQQYQG